MLGALRILALAWLFAAAGCVARSKPQLELSRASGVPASCAWSPDGRHVAVGFDGGAVRVYDATDGRVVAEKSGFARPRDVVFEARGRSSPEEDYAYFDWSGLAFDEAGSRLAFPTAGDAVAIWPWRTGADPMRLPGPRGGASMLAFVAGAPGEVCAANAGQNRVPDPDAPRPTSAPAFDPADRTPPTEAVRVALADGRVTARHAFAPDFMTRVTHLAGDGRHVVVARPTAEHAAEMARQMRANFRGGVFEYPDGPAEVVELVRVKDGAVERAVEVSLDEQHLWPRASRDGRYLLAGGRVVDVRSGRAASPGRGTDVVPIQCVELRGPTRVVAETGGFSMPWVVIRLTETHVRARLNAVGPDGRTVQRGKRHEAKLPASRPVDDGRVPQLRRVALSPDGTRFVDAKLRVWASGLKLKAE